MAVLVAASGCAVTGGTTDEVAADDSWRTLDTLPQTVTGPQLVPEVTLVGGGVPTVPQPQVPDAPGPTTAAPSAPAATSEPVPPVLAAPTGNARGTVSLELPAPVPGGARALERLANDKQREVAAQALARIGFDWRTGLPGWQIRFLPGRSGYRGSTFPDTKVIEVYVRNSDRPEKLAHVIAHEMGHAVDVSRLGPLQRETWRTTRGIAPDVPWFPSASGATDFSTGAGDFAESFAYWQSGVDWFSRLGPPPSAAQIAVMSALSGVS